ncbi:helix-turn-helix domain-containing protein, partial [uncultured Porphyromonas sp.]
MKQRKDTKSNSSQGSKNRPTKGHATTAERLEALKRYYVNGYSIQLLANQYQVTSWTIRNWIRTFEQENPEV